MLIAAAAADPLKSLPPRHRCRLPANLRHVPLGL